MELGCPFLIEARVGQGGRREGVCSFIEARVGQGGRREHVSI